MNKTYQPKAKEVKREHHTINADDQVLGRLATKVVSLLTGKYKPNYSPHMDMGDFVTIQNAAKVVVTGKKESQKVYFKHSGYPGGLKKVQYSKLKTEHPTRIIELAVKRMLPKNRLQSKRMKRLTILKGEK